MLKDGKGVGTSRRKKMREVVHEEECVLLWVAECASIEEAQFSISPSGKRPQ